MSISEKVEDIRSRVDKVLTPESRDQYGQFMTNWRISDFMSRMIDVEKIPVCDSVKVLDPGAGVGSLSSSLAQRIMGEDGNHRKLLIQAFEIDPVMKEGLRETYKLLSGLNVESKIEDGDFIEKAVGYLCPEIGQDVGTIGEYDVVIMNPPYKKIQSNSRHRILLRKSGVETSNLYTAFWHLSILMSKPGSQICSIVPRSFCNGTYFKHFRKFLKASCHIDCVHLFKSRRDAFSDNNVLQENVIFSVTKKCEKDDPPSSTVISTSSNDYFEDISSVSADSTEIWGKGNDCFIFLPTSKEEIDLLSRFQSMPCSLEETGIKISTGPVVQFRMKDHFRCSTNDVPMIYCSNLRNGVVKHDPKTMKSSPYIESNENTRKWLVGNNPYLLIRRFSSKEERRRIFSSVYLPEMIKGESDLIGIDNKVNFATSPLFLDDDQYLYGFFVYLSCSLVDRYYRMVSGHTQVNAGDLRFLRYPTPEQMKFVGSMVDKVGDKTQEEIDSLSDMFF